MVEAAAMTDDQGGSSAHTSAQGVSHPALPLMKQFLRASADARASGQPLLAGVASTVVSIAQRTGEENGYATGNNMAASAQDACEIAVDKLPPSIVAGLEDLWNALADEGQRFGMEEVEELVLAHLCEYPQFLTEVLLVAPLEQVGLGQGFMSPGDRQVDMAEVRRRLSPNLARHRDTAVKMASEACSHLMDKSETLASKLFLRLDLDRDGSISRDEFLRAAPHALALEVENPAIGAGVQALLLDPEYADDFHTAMAGAMGIVP
jgi:hypothetical protein